MGNKQRHRAKPCQYRELTLLDPITSADQLTEVHAAQWVVSQRVEHLPVVHELWWEEKLGYGLGYAKGRWTGQAS